MAPPKKDRALNGRLFCRVELWELERWSRAARLVGESGRSEWVRKALHLVAEEVERLSGVEPADYQRQPENGA